ncbi:MAG: CRISPR-associated endonuclease Cas1 [Bacteroidia bacterium]
MQLVVDRQGSRIRVSDGLFVVRQGEEEQRIPPARLRSIVLQPATALSHEVVRLAVSQEIEILFLDESGFPFARLWSPRFGSISTIRKNQVAFAQGAAGLAWVRKLLVRKLENQTVILSLLRPASPDLLPTVQDAIAQIEGQRERIRQAAFADIAEAAPTLRGLEGSSGRVYFQTLSLCLPEPYRFEKRSRQPAMDMFNALLNYAYGMLYGIVEGALIKAGLDPYLGVFHRDDYNRPVLAFDFIEPYRVWAEYVVIRLCMDRAIFVELFEQRQGGYWLAREGKRLLIYAMNDYLQEIVELQGQERSRRVHIELEAQALAQEVKAISATEP